MISRDFLRFLMIFHDPLQFFASLLDFSSLPSLSDILSGDPLITVLIESRSETSIDHFSKLPEL